MESEIKERIREILNILILILLIAFSIFIIYQLIIKIFGGSWTTESIIVSLVLLIIASLFVIAGFLISISRTIGKIETKLNNLKDSFCNLAKDFKHHLSK
ncbi:hypothetical protein FJZ19_06155 [Candidatus Pacearchaeota archaeon]|nr:hypothetical protein [Candidatus Pacearchaeota archaeon]